MSKKLNQPLLIGDTRWKTWAEGPGERTALWLQGCSLGCQGCCNPHLQSYDGGVPYTPEALLSEIIEKGCASLTLVGGEPLDQCRVLIPFLELFRRAYSSAANIWLFSGYPWETIRSHQKKKQAAALCDLVIAGPYRQNETPDVRKWIGSRNQTIHPITPSERKTLEHWPEEEYDIEVIVTNDEVLLNGWPV